MEIIHNSKNQEFYTLVNGNKAYVSYRIHLNSLDIRHTVVPKSLEGQGIASALVKYAYDYALENHLQAMATCSYAVVWLQRHPEYQGTVSSDYHGHGSCAL